MEPSAYPSNLEPVTESENNFRKKLFVHSHLVQLIEDTNLQRYALQCIPAEELKIKATQMLSTLEGDYCFEECLVLELLQWFKSSFFSWVDVPECQKCGQPTENRGTVTPTSDELLWFARTVEHYYCNDCHLYVRFPRYNHPRKLLETRKGRCGEWGKCFALLCRALDLDIRFVVDWNDHIWIEMFSPLKQRWIHCDPCENICDQPLMYEIGWKKMVTFIIAFSKDEVQDVTWRYTCQFTEVLKRRRAFQCRETFILNCINYFTEKCRSKASSEVLAFLLRRQALELAEFLSHPKQDNTTLGGRTSGSKAWRLARGEIETDKNSYTFNLNIAEIDKKHFHIQYNCALDEYIRKTDDSHYKNWKSKTFQIKDIFRKVEQDWKVVYLARTEGSSIGSIVWKFDFSRSGLVIQTLKLNLSGATFDNGEITWRLSSIQNSGPHVEKVFSDKVLSLSPHDTKNFKGSIGLTITAELSKGKGSIAWQHAQLFRQELSSNSFPFEVEIFFEKLNISETNIV